MTERMFMKADEVAEVLEVSKPYAYKLIRQMNKELKAKGCLVIAGRVDRRYFYDNFYGNRENGRKEGANAGL
ncbi:MAG: DNA-binding protein [Blautia sp.]|jgi:hypothetical protein|nr:DNA-binding protein [Clostridia bacterium]MBO6269876.1 DNA-binding protein [Clostridium sp.]MBQ9064989.1 DNA-binding protein [Blautia sp.]